MKSHSYPSGNIVWRVVSIPMAMVLLFAVLMHGLERTGQLTPWPLLDLDRTIVTHQVSLATRAPPAQIVWLGDSSCLMNVDATRHAGMINLGTISHLGLEHHVRLLARYMQHAVEPPELVVVFVHQDALRRERDDTSTDALFESLMSGKPARHKHTVSGWLGFDLFRECILARLLPIPLTGAYGRRYGYTRETYNAMGQHAGSLIAAGRYDPRRDTGNNELRLGEKVMNEATKLHTAWPSGIRLAIGLAPVPASFATRNHTKHASAILREWNQHMKADIVLDQLPLVLPDHQFADRRHLNAAGRTTYTDAALKALGFHTNEHPD